MTDHLPLAFDIDAAVFPVSVAASMAEMHPQTLRGYDRLGLVVPVRTRGRGRRYTLRDVAKLRHIQQLSQEDGINLEGIRRILELEAEVESLHKHIEKLQGTLTRLADGEPRTARIFTAETSGDVHHGRYRSRSLRELTYRRER